MNNTTFTNTDAITSDIGKRDSEILRLWQAKWTARKIADYLGIKAYIVSNVVYKNGRARNSRGPRKCDSPPMPLSTNRVDDHFWLRLRRPGRRSLLMSDLLKFLHRCSDDDLKHPFLPWLQQLPDDAVIRLADLTNTFVMTGLRKPVRKQLRPVLQILRRVELQGADEQCTDMKDDELYNALWDVNSSLCVRLGILPAQDGPTIYAKPSLFKQTQSS
jgi:hypothetical protein